MAGTSKVSLACMKKPHAPVPISVKASEAPEVQTGLRVRRMVVAAMSMLRELRRARELTAWAEGEAALELLATAQYGPRDARNLVSQGGHGDISHPDRLRDRERIIKVVLL